MFNNLCSQMMTKNGYIWILNFKGSHHIQICLCLIQFRQNLFISKVGMNSEKQTIAYTATILWDNIPTCHKDLNVFIFSNYLKFYFLSVNIMNNLYWSSLFSYTMYTSLLLRILLVLSWYPWKPCNNWRLPRNHSGYLSLQNQVSIIFLFFFFLIFIYFLVKLDKVDFV